MTRSLLIMHVVLCACSVAIADDWQQKVKSELPRLGHRNWIVIADSAYPLQNSSGIEMLVTSDDQVDVVKTVLDAVAKSKHVQPKVLLDAELPLVDESDARGISKYRDKLSKVLKDAKPTSLPHEEIIDRLSKAGEGFRVLVIKTPLALPYTSVFIELDCGYWNADAEQRLRAKMSK